MCYCRKLIRVCRGHTETARIKRHLQKITDLDATQKEALEFRYIHILQEFSVRCARYAFLYHIGHLIITVGSLLVPALLSVQYTDSNVNIIKSSSLQAQVYWVTWTISFFVTMFNGIIVLYKVDKKYYYLHTTRERLRSEGWQYFQLTGRYAGTLIHHREPATHKNQLIYFCHYIEKIRMKQIEEEYYKYDESNQPQTLGHGKDATTGKDLYSATLSEDVEKMYKADDTPPTVRSILSKLIQSAKRQSTDQEAKNVVINPTTVSNINLTTDTSVKVAPIIAPIVAGNEYDETDTADIEGPPQPPFREIKP